MLDTADFATFKVRGRLIALLSEARETELHTRELIRRSGRSPRAVQVALEQLSRQGILRSRRVGNMRLWTLNRSNPLLGPLQELAKRTVGLPAQLRDALRGVEGVRLAFIFGSFALGTEDTTSDIDVFVYGEPDWRALSRVNGDVRAQFAREVNIVAWTSRDLRERRADPFYRSIRTDPKIWLIGREGDLEEQERALARAVRGRDPDGASRKERRPKEAGSGGTQPRARSAKSRG